MRVRDPPHGNVEIAGVKFDPDELPAQSDGGNSGGSTAHEWVEDGHIIVRVVGNNRTHERFGLLGRVQSLARLAIVQCAAVQHPIHAVEPARLVPEDDFATLPIEEVESALDAVGLSNYRDRSDVKQRASGKFKLTVGDGKITVEIDRPIRIVIRPQDLLGELPEILAAMKSKGLKP